MDEPLSQLLPRAGDVIDGKYTLEGLLGRGGMGAVYAARHNKLGHRVAIKVMIADAGEEAARRFVNEGSAAANIQNEHVVRVVDVDVDEARGHPYMVLELLEGEDLAQLLDREGSLPAHVATGYMLEALEGVRQAHGLGIVHRDLKPSNLFLARLQSGKVVVKVLDFGISKSSAASPLGQSPSVLTGTKSMLGSPLYMSPEQLRSAKNVDARADIWGMGVILFELISGTLPFRGENLGELFAAILETDAPSLQSVASGVPPGLAAIVKRCLERRPENRYQTVAELERALAPFTNPALAGAQYQTRAMSPMSSPMSGSMSGPAASNPMMMSGGPGAAFSPAATMMRPDPVMESGPHAPVVKGTALLGAVTPQPQRQTGNTWQSSGPHARTSNKVMLAVLTAAGGLAVIGLVLVYFAFRDRVPTGSTKLPASSGITSASEVAAPTSPPSALAMPASTSTLPTGELGTSAGPGGAAPSASSSATTTATGTTPTGTTPTGSRKSPPAPATAKVEPSTVRTAAPPPPRPLPAPSGNSTLQGNR